MSSVPIISGAVGVGLVIGALIAYFLFDGFRIRACPPCPIDDQALVPAPVGAQPHDIYFRLQILDGKTEAVKFPAALSVQQLIEAFVTDEKMRIQPPDPEQWHLFDENTGEQLDPNKSLQQNGVAAGHLLKLLPRKPAEVNPAKPLEEDSRVLIRCKNGHYYDPKTHTLCPFCGVGIIGFGPLDRKRSSSSDQPTRRAGNQSSGIDPENGDSAITLRAALVDSTSIDPVVGWLVAVGGPDKGRDYRIRSENNTIGRSKAMNICISGDDAISRERHAIITFDPTRNAFYLSPGEVGGLVFVNGNPVVAPQLLRPGDLLTIGKTTLRFVPFADAAETYGGGGKADMANSSLSATRDSFRCSVFHPEKIGPDDVAKIIAYVHLEIAANKVVRNASQKLELSPTVRMVANSETSSRQIPRCSTVEVTVEVPGLLFENDRASMRLWEDMQSVEFRFKPAPGMANTACCGRIHFWLAGLLLADVKVTVFVADDCVPEIFREQLAQANAKPYRRIFPSYSHRDAAVVERLETYAVSFGDDYLEDVKKLRSGQAWNPELLAFIKGADVFQLFWSGEAAASKYVEEEWRSALKERESRADPFFLRPVYWTHEPAPIPSELSHLHFARIAIRE
jgi:hypothetical protein